MTNSIIRRGLSELGVELILALSPQAKGRVERLFGTLQDRLIKEMRVAAIASMEKANVFLGGLHPLLEWPLHGDRRRAAGRAPAHANGGGSEHPVLRKRRTGSTGRLTFLYHNTVWQIVATDADGLRPKQRVTIESRFDGSV